MKASALSRLNMTVGELFVLLSAALLFIVLRLLGWSNSPELENHDSLGYLHAATVFRSLDMDAIINLNPGAAPLLPLLTGLMSFLPGDMETAARLVSLLSSIAAMIAVYLIGRRIHNHMAGVLAVVLLAVSAHYFRTSYAVLTEPLYIALFSWIVLVFLATVEKPSLRSGATLGILCGLAFLTRVEAVLLLPALPLLHLAFALLRKDSLPLPAVAYSNLVLILAMMAIAAPQVIRVSSLMNTFALNSRSAWAAIIANPDGKSYNEKLWGLDHDPHTLNLDYLQTRPEHLRAMVQDTGYLIMLKEYASTAARNVVSLHNRQLVELVGLPLLVFSVIGFLKLLNSGRGEQGWLLAAFMGLALVAPVLYQVTYRHLLIIVPLLCILAAPGIIEVSNVLASQLGHRGLRKPMLFAGLALAVLLPVGKTAGFILQPDTANGEYSEESLQQLVGVVRSHTRDWTRTVRIMSRKGYLAYYSGSTPELPPYTDLAGLTSYMEEHDVDLFFYEEQHLADYPFVGEMGSEAWSQRFRLLHAGGADGNRQILYAVREWPVRGTS